MEKNYHFTLTLHTHAEEKRVRARQMWARAAIFTGLGMQR
jgi:hypothetical protein